MTKFTNELLKTYKLIVPTKPSTEWLKSKSLQAHYACYVCGKEINIHDIMHVELMGKRPICKHCARVLEPIDEDTCPIAIN